MIDLILPLRLVQFLFAIICLGLIGSSLEFFNGREFAVAESQFMIFVSVWTLVLVPYLTLAPIFWERFANKFAVLALEALTMLSWFAAFVALAMWGDDVIRCYGPGSGACTRALVALVLSGFEWLLFIPTTILAAVHMYKTRGSTVSKPAADAEA